MKIIQEFKAFAMRGNVVDLAIGVVIGAAFGKIIGSLVDNILTPALGALTNSVDLKDLAYTFQPPFGNAKPIIIGYGIFINSIISFIIVAFCIFLMIKLMNTVIKKEEAKPAPPSNEEKLLTEIRDLLKNRP
jgi:large conductance mechanosensitive channel